VAVQRNPHINSPNPHTITAMMGRSLKDRPGSSCCDADPARVPSSDNKDESGSGLKARSRLALFLEIGLCHRRSDGRLRRRCRVRLRPLFSIEMRSTKAFLERCRGFPSCCLSTISQAEIHHSPREPEPRAPREWSPDSTPRQSNARTRVDWSLSPS
jgi:hypothetical protein